MLNLADIFSLIIDRLDVPEASNKNHRVFPQPLPLTLVDSAGDRHMGAHNR
jgi:hypothetical protein